MNSKSIIRSGIHGAARLPALARMAGLAAAATALAVCSAGGSARAAQNGPASAVLPSCQTTDLHVWFGKSLRTNVADQHRVPVWMKNNGTKTCTLIGYPSVQLVGDGGRIRLSVPHRHELVFTVVLHPGHRAFFRLTYLAETAQEVQGQPGAWGPKHVLITPPNNKLHATLDWPFIAVVRSSTRGAHPGTYIAPIRA